MAEPNKTTPIENNLMGSNPTTPIVEQPKVVDPIQETVQVEPIKIDLQDIENSEQLGDDALIEIEKALQDTPPDEVELFQKELSKLLKVDLLTNPKASELFAKYKPTTLGDKAQAVVDKLTSKVEQPVEPMDIQLELLKTRVELELLKNGCPQEWLEDAVILSLSKVKNASDLTSVKAVATKYAGIQDKQATTITTTTTMIPARTSASIGEKKDDLTDGERAVAYLKKKYPKDFK